MVKICQNCVFIFLSHFRYSGDAIGPPKFSTLAEEKFAFSEINQNETSVTIAGHSMRQSTQKSASSVEDAFALLARAEQQMLDVLNQIPGINSTEVKES